MFWILSFQLKSLHFQIDIFDSPDSKRANPVCMVNTIKQHNMMYPASTPDCPGAPPNTFRGGSAFLSELPENEEKILLGWP